MTVVAILFLIILFIGLFGSRISAWFAQKARNKAEDYIRDQMGLPPRPGSKRDRRERKAANKNRYYSSAQNKHKTSRSSRPSPVDYMRMYAEDVEFEEIKIETPEGEERVSRTSYTKKEFTRRD